MNSAKQTVLAFIFAGTILMGFVGVYYVDNYTGPEPTILWESDSAAVSEGVGFATLNMPYTTFEGIWTGQSVTYPTTPSFTFENYNRTTVYLGNNTWSMASNHSAASNDAYTHWCFEIPELENWIIDGINISFSTPAGETNLEFGTTIYYPVDGSIDRDLTYNNGIQIDRVYSFTPTDNFYVRNLTVPLYTALEVQDASLQEIDEVKVSPILVFTLLEITDNDGINAYASTIKITITGEPISGWSQANMISLIIGASIVANVIVGVFLTDDYDVGGKVKDLRNRRTDRSRGRR